MQPLFHLAFWINFSNEIFGRGTRKEANLTTWHDQEDHNWLVRNDLNTTLTEGKFNFNEWFELTIYVHDKPP